jgi:Gpi18-like mannosyltransferase
VKLLNELKDIKNSMLLQSNKKDICNILIIFLFSRFLFFVLLFLLSSVSGIQYDSGSVYLQFDGQHYLNIAVDGYTHKYQYAFFPLFPLIIRFFGFFGVPILGTILLNHVLTILIAYLLYYIGLTVMKKSAEESLTISLLWIFSPIAIATCTMYSEAMFVFLTVLSYYLYKRNRYIGSGILIGLSIAIRSLGSALFFSIFIVMIIELFKDRDWKGIPKILKLFIPATGIALLYPLYQYIKLGNWHYFLDVQFLYWGRMHTNIIETIFRDISNFDEMYILFVFTYLALAICLYIVYNAIKTKEDPVLIIYMLVSILLIFSTSRELDAVSSASFYRYLFGCSAAYLLVNRNLNLKLITILTTILCILAIIFFCGGAFLI